MFDTFLPESGQTDDVLPAPQNFLGSHYKYQESLGQLRKQKLVNLAYHGKNGNRG